MSLIASYITEQNYVVPFLSSIILLLIVTYITVLKHRKAVKKIPTKLQTHRLLTFQPEALVDKELVKNLENLEPLEILQPDENLDGTYNLAKINFLNLLNNEEIKKIAEKCIRTYGVGSCGPRGFYGTIDIHLNLESKIAEFMGLEETVLYSYGFSTIASAIGAYCKKSDIIFCDENISFAAKQGFVAARSKIVYFQHNDMKDLEEKLVEYEKKEHVQKKLFRKFLIVEGIYQKTGQICPLPELMKLREQYKLRIFIDETLSFGVLGKHGRGVTEHFNVDRTDVDMIMGSLEGSICSIGGFCVGASVVMEHQRLSGLGYCFSASLPPFLSQIAIYAIDSFIKNPSMFKKLESVAIIIDEKLKSLSYYKVISDPKSPLKVIKIADKTSKTLKEIHEYCKNKNIHFIHEYDSLFFHINMKMSHEDINTIVNVLEAAAIN